MSDLPKGWSEHSIFSYDRQGLALHLVIKAMNNHEIREILVGLWARLNQADQDDHIKELIHYRTEEASFLSGIAAQIRDAAGGP